MRIFAVQKIATRVLILAISIIFCVLLAEVLLSLSQLTRDDNLLFGNMLQHAALQRDTDLIWSFKSGFKTAYVKHPPTHPKADRTTYDFTINEQGRRGGSFSRNKPEHTYRIVCFGDSTTFGVWVRNDQAYPQILQSMLAKIPDKTYEVINCGVPGYSLSQGYRDYQLRASQYAPDCIILGFCGFNGSELLVYSDKERFSLLERYRYINSFSIFDIAVKIASFPRMQILTRREQLSDFQDQYQTWIENAQVNDCMAIALILPRQRQISYQPIPREVIHNLQDVVPLAEEAYQNGDHEKSQKLYERALECSDIVFDRLEQKEIRSVVRGHMPAVLSSMQASDPELIATNKRGLELWYNGKALAASKVFERCLKEHPNDAMTYYYCGACYQELQMAEWAARSFSKAMELTRSGELAHQIMARQIAWRERIPIVDMLMVMQLFAIPDMFIDAGHTGVEGYEMTAREIYKALIPAASTEKKSNAESSVKPRKKQVKPSGSTSRRKSKQR